MPLLFASLNHLGCCSWMIVETLLKGVLEKNEFLILEKDVRQDVETFGSVTYEVLVAFYRLIENLGLPLFTCRCLMFLYSARYLYSLWHIFERVNTQGHSNTSNQNLFSSLSIVQMLGHLVNIFLGRQASYFWTIVLRCPSIALITWLCPFHHYLLIISNGAFMVVEVHF